MYRIIVKRSVPEYLAVLAMSDLPSYDYMYNPSYACITLTSEAFSIVLLKYRTKPHADDDGKQYCEEYEDMPSYALLDNYYNFDDD